MGLWAELSSPVATGPAELLEREKAALPHSMPYIISAQTPCRLRLVSHCIYRRKQHYSSLYEIMSAEPAAHMSYPSVCLTLWWAASRNNCLVSADWLPVTVQAQQGCWNIIAPRKTHLRCLLHLVVDSLKWGPKLELVTVSLITTTGCVTKHMERKLLLWPSSNQSCDKWNFFKNLILC